jgi:glycosyltransferase involved in cell wall biosynthesis
MGLPTIVAPYAECEYIIEDGKNGFIAKTPKEWFEKIEKLFIDEQLRQRFRQAGWMTIIDKYDVPVIGRKLLKHLKEI